MKLTLESIANGQLLATLHVPLPPDEAITITLRLPRQDLPLNQLQIQLLMQARSHLAALVAGISGTAAPDGPSLRHD